MVCVAVSLEWSRVNSSVQLLKSSLMQEFIEIPYMTFYDQIVYIYIHVCIYVYTHRTRVCEPLDAIADTSFIPGYKVSEVPGPGA